MSWTPERESKLKELWKKGHTASEIASLLGETTRNAVIGKAHRLNLSSGVKTKTKFNNSKPVLNKDENEIRLKGRRNKFKSLLLDKNFEPAKNLTLEELTEDTCKYMELDPDEKDARFCGRKNVEKFSYCPLHLMVVFQPKGKKEEVIDKDEEVPKFMQKKVKSA